MKTALATLSIVASLALSSNAVAESNAELVEKYQKLGSSIVDMVNTKSVSASEVEAKVVELTRISVELANRYKKAHPEGVKLLDTIIEQVAKVSEGNVTGVGPMAELSFETIEHDWHDLGYFESHDVGVDLSDEDNEHFTDPIHTMVHPIMVLRAARDYATNKSDESLNLMKGEMEEGMEQAAVVKELLES